MSVRLRNRNAVESATLVSPARVAASRAISGLAGTSSFVQPVVGDVGGSVGRTVTPGEAPDVSIGVGVDAPGDAVAAWADASLPEIGADGPGLAQPATRAMATRSTGIAPARPSTRPCLVDGRRMPPLIVPLPGRGGHGGRPFDRG